MVVDTSKFVPECRVDLFVPTELLNGAKRGDDVTSLLQETEFLRSYADLEVAAIVIGNGKTPKTKVAFLWEDASDAEWWYISRKVSSGMNPDNAADKFYEVAQQVAA